MRPHPCQFCIGLLLLLVTSLTWSAPPLVLSDATDRINLLPYLEYLADRDGSLDLAQLRQRPEHDWHSAPQHRESLNFGYTDAVYWFRWRLENATPELQKGNLEAGYNVLDYLDLYGVRNAAVVRRLKLGDKLPFAARPLDHRNFVIPVTLPPQTTTTYYLRVETTSSMQVPLRFIRDASLLRSTQIEMLGLGLYFGTMGVMVLYNLFVFFSVRESNYLYYVLYVASIALFFASLSGVSFHYLWPHSTWWNDQSIVFFLACMVLFAALFTIRFLRVKENFPRLHHLGTLVVVVSVIIVISSLLFAYRTMIIVVIAWAVCGIALAIGVGMVRWISGDSSAKYYCISWFTLLFGGLVLALNKFDFLPRNFISENAVQIGSALEVILLSFALADRLNVEKRRRFQAQLLALENERVARLAQAEALQQEKNARQAEEQALAHEREAREAQAAALAIQRQATETLEQKVRERTQALEVANQRLEELTYTDGLTGIRNRRYLNRALEREFSRARRDHQPLAAIIIDIDHFKQFNDSHGHLAGDDCLREVARSIQACALRENDVVARYGGEEFFALLPNTDQAGALQVAEQIRAAIGGLRVQVGANTASVTASLGVSTRIPQRGETPEPFVAAADQALYQAKTGGRNQVRYGEPDYPPPS